MLVMGFTLLDYSGWRDRGPYSFCRFIDLLPLERVAFEE